MSEIPQPPIPNDGPAVAVMSRPRADRLGIAAFVIGVVAIVSSIIGLGVVLGPIATALGFVSNRRQRGNLARAAMVLGVIAFVGSIAWVFYSAWSMGW
jgi:multisubunit Na+/H+ antiporter MnhF subunit